MANYYQIFGVAPNASLQEIKTAYKKLALQHHPDRNPNDPQAEENFKHINEIYQTLSDEYKRMAYDYLLLYQSQQIRQTIYTASPYSPAPHRSYANQNTTQKANTSQPTVSYSTKIKVLLITLVALFTVAIMGFVLYKFAKTNNEQNMLKTARQYIKDQKPLQALNLLNTLLEKNPTQMDAILIRARLFVAIQNHWQALQDLNVLLSNEKYSTSEVYFLKGKCLFFLYNFEEANVSLEQAIQLDQTQAEYYGMLAIVQKKQNLDSEIICENWKKAQGTRKNFYFEEMQEFCQ